MEMIKEIIKNINKVKSRKDFLSLKKEIAKKYKAPIPPNSEIIEKLSDKKKEKLIKILRKKPTRTISGIAVVAVMTPPAPCPHGKCIYCPSAKNVPESYTGKEPAARRGLMLNYDPYLQVQTRLKQLCAIGHDPQKIELILMGGTFPARPFKEQENFVKLCLLAMNRFPKQKPKKVPSLEKVQRVNEKAKIRCVGMTFETRPDYCFKKEIKNMLKLGGTRIEIGVQTVFDKIYKLVNRGHTINDVIKATQLSKDSGFKICYHMMLGLPGSNFELEIKSFKEIFENQNFKPDMIKIYPTIVTKGTKLYNWWKEGKYKPLTEKEAIRRIIEIKKIVPEWVRIMRIERDVPSTEIEAGIKMTNLRELVQYEMKKLGISCRCIRCREVGHKLLKENYTPEKIKLHKIEYEASNGKEIFLQYKDKRGALIGFLRLRFPYKPFIPELKDSSIVRELHVYGEQIPIGKRKLSSFQHKGYGRKLLKEAEKISKEAGYKKISIISGIGVREYYRKLGYRKNGPYMAKKL